MIRNNRVQLFIASTFVVIIISALVVILMLISDNHDEKRNLSKEGILVTYSGMQDINLNSLLPLSDDLGKNFNINEFENGIYGYLNLSVRNVGNIPNNYKIYLTKNSLLNEINEEYIKIYLTDENGKPYNGFSGKTAPNYSRLSPIDNKPDFKLLFSDRLNVNEEKHYMLRVWVSDVYTDIMSNNSFSLHVGVYSF